MYTCSWHAGKLVPNVVLAHSQALKLTMKSTWANAVTAYGLWMNQALCWETGVFREGLRGGDIWDDAKSWEGTRHAKSWEKNIPDGEIAIAKIKVTELINGYFSTSNLPSTLGPQPKVTDVNLKKKKAQRESHNWSFIWGKMRNAAWETAPQIALRNCSKEAGGKVSTYEILVKGNTCNQERIFPVGFHWAWEAFLLTRNSPHCGELLCFSR